MSRKQAICFFIAIILAILAGLFFLAVIHIWVMLGALLLLVVGLIVLLRKKPDLFWFLRKKKKEDVGTVHAAPPESVLPVKDYIPNLILVSSKGTKSSTLTGTQIVVNKPEFSIGRSESCDCSLQLSHDISRKHCIVRFDKATETSYIVDNNSSNGTFLNGKRLTPKKAYPIRNGDSIQLGSLRYIAQIAHY